MRCATCRQLAHGLDHRHDGFTFCDDCVDEAQFQLRDEVQRKGLALHKEATDRAHAAACLTRDIEDAPVLCTDSDAVEALKVKLEDAKAAHEAAKAFGKALRKCKTVSEVEALGVPSHMATYRMKFGNASTITNASANVRRIEKRIAYVTRLQAAPAAPEVVIGDVRIVDEEARTRIFFDGKPSEEKRAELKRHGFRWSPTAGAWQRQATPQARRAAIEIVGGGK